MTTTDLIKLLQKVEFGASGRPREITFRSYNRLENGFDYWKSIEIIGSGDGIAGAELKLDLI
jgi:hypothetical protein